MTLLPISSKIDSHHNPHSRKLYPGIIVEVKNKSAHHSVQKKPLKLTYYHNVIQIHSNKQKPHQVFSLLCFALIASHLDNPFSSFAVGTNWWLLLIYYGLNEMQFCTRNQSKLLALPPSGTNSLDCMCTILPEYYAAYSSMSTEHDRAEEYNHNMVESKH